MVWCPDILFCASRKQITQFKPRYILKWLAFTPLTTFRFRRADNNVANAFSWDYDRTNDKLSQILRSHCSSQLLPQHFEVVPLPNEIV